MLTTPGAGRSRNRDKKKLTTTTYFSGRKSRHPQPFHSLARSFPMAMPSSQKDRNRPTDEWTVGIDIYAFGAFGALRGLAKKMAGGRCCAEFGSSKLNTSTPS